MRITDLSQSLAVPTGSTTAPLVLYGRDQVPAQPLMTDCRPLLAGTAPLPAVTDVADAPLAALADGAALPMGLIVQSKRSNVLGHELDGCRFHFVTTISSSEGRSYGRAASARRRIPRKPRSSGCAAPWASAPGCCC